MAAVHGLFGSILELGLSCLDLYWGQRQTVILFPLFLHSAQKRANKQTNKNHLPSWDGHSEGVVEMMFMMVRSGRVPEELWTEVRDIVQEAVIRTIPKKKKCKKVV